MKSPKTTIAGIAALVAALATAAAAYFDGNPATTVDWPTLTAAIAAGLAGLGLIAARDNNVTSREAGAE